MIVDVPNWPIGDTLELRKSDRDNVKVSADVWYHSKQESMLNWYVFAAQVPVTCEMFHDVNIFSNNKRHKMTDF